MPATILSRLEITCLPITALAFLQLGAREPYLLAGEGQFLKVFDGPKGHLICKKRIFDSQAVHGIACDCESLPHDAPSNRGTLLIWGGRSICLVSIRVDVCDDGRSSVHISERVPEVLWHDWILDGCFRSLNAGNGGSGPEALLVTAHDAVIGLKINAEAGIKGIHEPYHIASGPSSLLYSAHILWEDLGRRLLVAAGTVFGEVLLWSCDFDHSATPQVLVHYRYTGHDGSVFGVRISEQAQDNETKRILASCSDDRTIRIWDISDTGSSEGARGLRNGHSNTSDIEEASESDATGCVATIMGHASRIWGVRFFGQRDGCWNFMTYGEDSTAQAWRVCLIRDKGGTPHGLTYQISHQTTYSYHLGKNLWAMAVFHEADGDHVVATGGADGRISTYTLLLHGASTPIASRISQYTMDEVSKTLQTASTNMNPATGCEAQSWTRRLFDSLKGSWRLSRNLDSAISSYPSGTLEGIATFAPRPSSDESYEAEYLYSESGDFTTAQGLTMKATRQYVYRYCKSTDEISVWFVKPDDGSTVDYFFHKLEFRETEPGVEKALEVRIASGYHLCVEDNYNASYSFQLKNSKITQWYAIFDVDGPKKGYIAKATYTREPVKSKEPEDEVIPSRNSNGIALSKSSRHDKPDAFKTYSWMNENEFLTTTEQGNLYLGTVNSHPEATESHFRKVAWEYIGHLSGLISSSIATSISSLGLTLLTGTDGTIYCYSHGSKQLETVSKLPGKAGFLEAHTLSIVWRRWSNAKDRREMIAIFATCLGSSQATMFILSLDPQLGNQSTNEAVRFSVLHERKLTLPSSFIVTSSCFLDTDEWIILGSRNGDIAVYDLFETTPYIKLNVTPSCFPSVHGEDAITLIRIVPRDKSILDEETAILTAGRDGKWGIHHVSPNVENSKTSVTLTTIHESEPPFGPNIEGACIDSTSRDLLFWGFRSKQFVVWNESQKIEVMAVDCGGAHRHWAYAHNHDGSGGGSFVYTKASVCYVQSQPRPSHHVVQHGGHGREIKAIAVSPAIKTNNDNANGIRFVATGAEDTNIRIFDLNDDDDTALTCRAIMTKHTTGIQQLRWSPKGHLLFSAAGCEEFSVWGFQPAGPLVTVGVVCEATCPTVTEEADLRIMDFAVEEVRDSDDDDHKNQTHYILSIVYSDSSVRIFRYRSPFAFSSPSSTDRKQGSFHLLSISSYTTSCLTRATHLYASDNNKTLQSGLLCTASTDGHLAFWPLPAFNGRSSSSTPPSPLNYTTRTPRLHQNSIKSLASVHIPISTSPRTQHRHRAPSPTSSSFETLIITGGDDGAITFTRATLTILSHSPSFSSSFPDEFKNEKKNGKKTDMATKTMTTHILTLPRAHASAVTGLVILPHDELETQPHNYNNHENENDNDNRTSPSPLLSTQLCRSNSNENDIDDPPHTLSHSHKLVLISASTDQRLKIWDIDLAVDSAVDTDELGGHKFRIVGMKMRVTRMADLYTAVADVGALSGWVGHRDYDRNENGDQGNDNGDGSGSVELLVAGIGIEKWRIPLVGLGRSGWVSE